MNKPRRWDGDPSEASINQQLFEAHADGRRELSAENARLRNMVYRLARHVRNTDGLPVTRWAVHAGMLLDELRAADEAEYDRLVKGSEPTAGVAVEGGVGGGTDPR